MRRRGRRRKSGKREPNGKLQRHGTDHAITPEALKRRADMTGRPVPTERTEVIDLASKKALGLAIGIIRQRKGADGARLISYAEYSAARQFESLWMSWRHVAGIKTPWELPQGFGPSTPFDHLSLERQKEILEDFAELQAQVKAILADLDKLPQKALVRATIETIIIDNVLPEPFLQRPAAIAALKAGLAVLMRHFPVDEDAEDPGSPLFTKQTEAVR